MNLLARFSRWLHADTAPLTARVKVERTVRHYDRALCEMCGRSVAIRQDGEPHARRHRCHIHEPVGQIEVVDVGSEVEL